MSASASSSCTTSTGRSHAAWIRPRLEQQLDVEVDHAPAAQAVGVDVEPCSRRRRRRLRPSAAIWRCRRHRGRGRCARGRDRARRAMAAAFRPSATSHPRRRMASALAESPWPRAAAPDRGAASRRRTGRRRPPAVRRPRRAGLGAAEIAAEQQRRSAEGARATTQPNRCRARARTRSPASVSAWNVVPTPGVPRRQGERVVVEGRRPRRTEMLGELLTVGQRRLRLGCASGALQCEPAEQVRHESVRLGVR